MKLLKILNGKFLVVLSLAVMFIALTSFAAAQGKLINSGAASLVESSINTASASRHSGGVLVAFGDGSVRFSVEVFAVYLPNSPLEFDRVNANDPNAAVKIIILFEAADRMQSPVLMSIPQNSVSVPAKFRTARLTVSDGGENRTEIKMETVLVSGFNHGSSANKNDLIAVKFKNFSYR